MSVVLGDVIHPDQTCGIPGRKITDSLVLIRDTICYARDRNIRLIVLNLDFEKAFDRVSHQYLFRVLQKMGFPERYVEWVGLLYRDISSKFMVNGQLTKAVDLHCGVRQGCPLSALLYVTCIEPLAQVLRRDKWITGVGIPGSGGEHAKCFLYMDDINILCTDLSSLDRALNLTDDYGLASGSKLNRGKTQALFYGPWAETDKTGLPLTINTTDIKILGVKFDREGEGTKNWPDVLGKVRQRLGYWGLRGLTMEGKVLIIKAEREPVSPVRGLAIGEPTTVWRNVNHPALPNRLRDLSWMTAHEILPVRSVMHSRGMGANPTCPRQGCGAHETVRHVLWECTAAGDQWAMAGSLQFPYLPAGEVLTAQLVLYGVSPKKVPPALFQKQWLTLSAIKDAIWTSRNLLVRKRMLIPPVAVIRMAAATLKVVVAAGGRPRTQPQRSLASVPIRTWEPEPHN
ncbi:hypothetical protein NHX12_025826 [Muraenolepis orangiensis]|uniref:Reverse transcriptase domain-containing protein n=2 Tax=Muraenolepis orangiensis TaxID=630683 RepID=A0A9Q0DRP4_9TELE|nr:hypothetical protein NHX12_007110 [Muraenolepis orangiensis]KAJ3606305.1 hypothetical protein NHX12_025826 [Muraenolepis orangiensis]